MEAFQRADRAQHDRQPQLAAEQFGRDIDLADVAQYARPERDRVQRHAIAPQRGLGFDAADDVVPGVLVEILPRLGDDLVQVEEFVALRGGLQDRGFVQFLIAHCGDTRCWLRGRVGDFSLRLARKEGPSWSVFSVACGRGPERTRTADLRFRNWNLALCAVLKNYRDFIALCVRRSNARSPITARSSLRSPAHARPRDP